MHDKKIIFISIYLLITFFVWQTQALTTTLKGHITYTVDSARNLTFDGIKEEISVWSFKAHLKDPNYKANMDYIKYGVAPYGWKVEVFQKGKFKLGYAVTYDSNEKVTYYYAKFNGSLIAVEHNDIKSKSKYPYRCYRYDTSGKLIAAGIHINKNEGFLYDKNKKLITHRIGNYGYDEKGKRQWKAKLVDF